VVFATVHILPEHWQAFKMGSCKSLLSQETDVRLWKYDTANLVGIGCHYAVEVDGQLWEFTGDKKGSKLDMNMGVNVANSCKKNGLHCVHNQLAYRCKTWEKKTVAQMEDFCRDYASTTPFDYELVVDNGLAFALKFVRFLLDGNDIPFKASSIFSKKHGGSLDIQDESESDYNDHDSDTASEDSDGGGSETSYIPADFETADDTHLLSNKKTN
jgi:hypothetical protein